MQDFGVSKSLLGNPVTINDRLLPNPYLIMIYDYLSFIGFIIFLAVQTTSLNNIGIRA
jgi:hypothetical protein